MTPRRCPYCHQALAEFRLGGIRLPDLKARIFDLVMQSGNAGIGHDTLMALAYSNGADRFPYAHAERNGKTIKAHIYQINELIEDADYRIQYSQRDRVYRLKNLHEARR